MTGTAQTRRIVVVGGGIAGLAAAYRLLELSRDRGHPIELRLFEASARLGGNIETRRRDGFLIEGGPDAFITQKPAGIALCRRLGLTDQIIQTNPACRRTYIVRDGTMHPVPEGFLLLAPSRMWPFVTSRLFSWRAKLRMGLDLVLPRKDHGETGDESLADFVSRRFGREALERVAQPMVGGIYTADPAELSLRATMPRFLEMENRHRSIIMAMRAQAKDSSETKADSGARYSLFVSFREGMATLTDALIAKLPPNSLHTGSPVVKVEPLNQAEGLPSLRPTGAWRVHLQNDERIEADDVVLACPAHASARILEGLDSALASELNSIRYASAATMTLAYRSEQIPDLIDGFGFVVPALEQRTILAVTVSSTKFEGRAPQGHVLLRAFLGGAMFPQVYEMDDDPLRELVLKDLRELMHIEGDPLFAEFFRWPKSMPQYPVGHLDRVARIREQMKPYAGLFLVGNAFGGVGIPDCIASAEAAAEQLMATE